MIFRGERENGERGEWGEDWELNTEQKEREKKVAVMRDSVFFFWQHNKGSLGHHQGQDILFYLLSTSSSISSPVSSKGKQKLLFLSISLLFHHLCSHHIPCFFFSFFLWILVTFQMFNWYRHPEWLNEHDCRISLVSHTSGNWRCRGQRCSGSMTDGTNVLY